MNDKLQINDDANKLRTLADWFDVYDKMNRNIGMKEVQTSLREIADRIESIISERDGWIDVEQVTELHKLHWCEITDEFDGYPPSILLGFKATYGGQWGIYWLDGLSNIDQGHPNEPRQILRVSPLPSAPKQPKK